MVSMWPGMWPGTRWWVGGVPLGGVDTRVPGHIDAPNELHHEVALVGHDQIEFMTGPLEGVDVAMNRLSASRRRFE